MTVLNSSARILINNICGAAYTALYSVSYNIAAVLNLLNTSINSSYIPWFYKKMAAGEHGEISKVSTALLIVVGACSLLPALFGPEVVLILGSARYMEGVWIMPSAALGVYFTFLYSIFSNYELFFEESKAIMVASLMAAAFNILLNIIFLPVFGFVAAGYAALICYISLAFFHYLMARHISKQRANGIFPFDMQSIVIVSAALLLLSIGVQLTYFNTAIRYVAILIVAVTMFLKREVLLDTIKGMKRGER